MKKAEWEIVFSKSFCSIDCPRAATEASAWLHAQHPEFHRDKRFRPKTIKTHISRNAWPHRRKERERIISRRWLTENVGERVEQKKNSELAFLGRANMIAAYAMQLFASVKQEPKTDPQTGETRMVFKDPDQASIVGHRAARMLEVAHEMNRRSLGYEDESIGENADIWDNTITIKPLPLEKLIGPRKPTAPPVVDDE